MVKAMHVTVFVPEKDVEALRAFLRDVLELPSFDVGGGWLIFRVSGEITPHPTQDEEGQPPIGPDIGFSCDDLKNTISNLKGRGVQFVTETQDEGWGLRTRLRMPGGVEADLYETRYDKP
jgi:hypothetical protein